VKFSIINIKSLSGNKVNSYSIRYEDKEISELQSFLYKFQDSDLEILQNIYKRIQNIANKDGMQNSFFKRESPESHHVFRLLETGTLRIYCIIYSNIILLFGSGGYKIEGTRTLKENPHLEKEVLDLMKIEDAINRYLDLREMKITDDGFEGELNNLEL